MRPARIEYPSAVEESQSMSQQSHAARQVRDEPERMLMWGVRLLLVLTLLAYLPAMRAGYIWDDDSYVTQNPTLIDLEGLRKIWFEPTASPQYYPLVFTTFWIERHLWGLQPFGYHAVNIVLHALNAVLLWFLLRRFKVAGSWFIAAVFALHPVHVESVAWISERKNVLSATLYLSALLVYCRTAGLEGPSTESLQAHAHRLTSGRLSALMLYIGALLSKTVTCTLPVTVLLLTWWKRGRMTRRDVIPLIPMFGVGLVLGLTTAWIEAHHTGARGTEWDFSWAQRCLIAGRALWFYAAKLFWPAPLMFIYPRWRIDLGSLQQWAYPIMFALVLGVLWVVRRRIGRGPFVAVACFLVTLTPALGFVNVYPMKFSFVADHFQYLASIGMIACGIGPIAAGVGRLTVRRQQLVTAGGVAMLGLLLVLTMRQARIYSDQETLWRDVLRQNPSAWIAHNNLGCLLQQRWKLEEAAAHFRQAIQLKPGFADAHSNLGVVFAGQSRFKEAMVQYALAMLADSDYATPHRNLGSLLVAQGKFDEAIYHYREAVRLKPTFAAARSALEQLLAVRAPGGGVLSRAGLGKE